MRFLLDTDVFSAIARQISAKAQSRLAELPAGSVVLSVITCAEIAFGLERHPVSAGLSTRIERLQQILPILPVEPNVIQHYARARAELERCGTPMGPNDLWLAAQGLAEQVTIVTGNEREFRRVPGLRVENWLR